MLKNICLTGPTLCLTIFILDTCTLLHADYLATVKTQMKCWIILHFIRVCTVYLQVNEKNLLGQKYIILISCKYKMAKCTLIQSTCLGRSIRMKRVYKAGDQQSLS